MEIMQLKSEKCYPQEYPLAILRWWFGVMLLWRSIENTEIKVEKITDRFSSG